MEKENEVIGRSQKPQRQEVEREGEREGAETELARHEWVVKKKYLLHCRKKFPFFKSIISTHAGLGWILRG